MGKYLKGRKKSRAQISMEYILITGFSLLIAMPLVIIFFSNSAAFNENIVNSQTKTVLDEMMDAAQAVHYLGEPSQKTIAVYFPQYIQEVKFGDGYMGFVVLQRGMLQTHYKYASINFTGNLTTYAGLHRIKVLAVNNTVQFSSANS